MSEQTQTKPPRAVLQRDQARALHAYKSVEAVNAELQKNYKIAVLAFGTNILRSGLSAALSDLERKLNDDGKPSAALALMDHLRNADVPHIPASTRPRDVPAEVRKMGTVEYMLATRETLQVVVWLKRAVQATIKEA